jgi:hypothetical protein
MDSSLQLVVVLDVFLNNCLSWLMSFFVMHMLCFRNLLIMRIRHLLHSCQLYTNPTI